MLNLLKRLKKWRKTIKAFLRDLEKLLSNTYSRGRLQSNYSDNNHIIDSLFFRIRFINAKRPIFYLVTVFRCCQISLKLSCGNIKSKREK